MAGKTGRIHFLDEWRGIALIGMILYHTLYDLYAIFGVDFDFYSPYLNALQLFVCCSFIFIAGISARLSSKTAEHGLVVFGAGMLMTFGTYFFMKELTIWFGVLHFIGLSILLYSVFKKKIQKSNGAIFSLLSLVLFFCTWGLSGGTILFGKVDIPDSFYFTKYLAFLGLPGKGFSSGDYFPMIPWFFLFLCGAFLGQYFKDGSIPQFMYKKRNKFLSLVGSNTLIIYILHQPVIYGILFVIFKMIEACK